MQLSSSVKVRALEGYTGKKLWLGISQGWGKCRNNVLDGHVGVVTFHGAMLLACAEISSRHIAKNRVCSILANIFLMHPTLAQELGKLSLLLQKKEEARSKQ
jgi:hypothetical protein